MPSFHIPVSRQSRNEFFISFSALCSLHLRFLFQNIKNIINVLMQKICIILSCPWCLFLFFILLDYLRKIPSRNIPCFSWNQSNFSDINWKIKSGLRSRISFLLILRLVFSFLMSRELKNVLGKGIFSLWDLHICASAKCEWIREKKKRLWNVNENAAVQGRWKQ